MNLRTLGDFKKEGTPAFIQMIPTGRKRKTQPPTRVGRAAAWQSSIPMLQGSSRKLIEIPSNPLFMQISGRFRGGREEKELQSCQDNPL